MIRPRPASVRERMMLPELAVLAALALGCGSTEGSDEGGSGQSESSTSGGGCQSHDDCESEICHPVDHECVELGCDPDTEEIGPQPRDAAGDPCCTEKPGCTGYDRMGEPINPLYVGQTLVCVGVEWVEDPSYCADSCDEDTTLLGCVWDSTQGDFVKPQCVCQQGQGAQ